MNSGDSAALYQFSVTQSAVGLPHGCPGLPQLRGQWLAEEGGATSWMVLTDIVSGESLEARIGCGPAAEDEALALLRHLLFSLCLLHSRGIAHGDLRASRIILRDEEAVLLPSCDMLMARREEGNHAAKLAADLRSVGRLAVALLTGRQQDDHPPKTWYHGISIHPDTGALVQALLNAGSDGLQDATQALQWPVFHRGVVQASRKPSLRRRETLRQVLRLSPVLLVPLGLMLGWSVPTVLSWL